MLGKYEEIEIIFDEQRFLEVSNILIETYRNRQFAFLNPNKLPQNNLLPKSIERESVEHQLFLFFSALTMRAGINSDYVFKRLSVAYNDDRWRGIFQPRFFLKDIDSDSVGLALNNSGLGYKADDIAKSWENNAKQLAKYDYQPKLIFNGVENQQDVWNAFIGNGFCGWKEKIVSLLSLWFQEVGWIEPIYGAPPVDFHALRILINTEAVHFFDKDCQKIFPSIRSEKIIKKVLLPIDQLCQREKIFSPDLSASLWLWSRSVCKNYLQNGKYCAECLLSDYCKAFISYYSKIDGKLHVLQKESPVKQFLLNI